MSLLCLCSPRIHFKDHSLKGAPPGSVGAAARSGWSSETTFLQCMTDFIEHVKPTPERPVILLLDNHESHMNGKENWDYCGNFPSPYFS